MFLFFLLRWMSNILFAQSFFLQLDDVSSTLKLGLLLLEQKIEPYF
jgi:hypothetical protein